MSSIYSVGQVNTYIKRMFQQDFMLSRIYVRGEVSNLKYHPSGHIYFSLKDDMSAISCVMFAGSRRGLAFQMKDGDKVVVGGSVNVYEKSGHYQLYAKEIKREGSGLLYERFLALKQELEEMGMFASEYKQPIPAYVRKMGVVTASSGAAIQDIRNISYRRNPYIQIILYPALVQGEGAKESIVRGIETLDQMNLDVIIVGRGGGSIEDLWAFNEESVARAIFNCNTPVISAVGHETDTTIADFVADLRAPTPSAAAELAVTDIRSLFNQMEEYQKHLRYSMQNKVIFARRRLEGYETRWNYLNPQNQIIEKRQHLLEIEQRIQYRMERVLTGEKHRLSLYIQHFKGLSPLDRLNRGFSYVEDETGHAVTKISQVNPGNYVKIQVSDGELGAQIKTVVPAEREMLSKGEENG